MLARPVFASSVFVAAIASMVLTSATLTSVARANGAFPSSGQVILDPNVPGRVYVRTNFGLLRSEGTGFSLVCESALGIDAQNHPHMALTQEGRLFFGLADGLALGDADGCTFARVPELDGWFIVDVSAHPSGLLIAVGGPASGMGDARIFTSADDGATFVPTAASLPTKFTPLSVDFAATDPTRIYVSGLLGAQMVGAIVTSTDSGASFTAVPLVGTSVSSAPFIAAVDPLDADLFYIRQNGAPGKILRSIDGGVSFEQIAWLSGFLRAFALAPDGTKALVGGEIDGIASVDLATFVVTEISDVRARCLSWKGDVVYACGSEIVEGWSAARSDDFGVTFTPFLEQECIEGPFACAASTPVGALCGAEWPSTREKLGVVDCDANVTSASSSAASSSTGVMSGSGGDGAGGTDGANGVSGGGCGCSTSGRPVVPWFVVTVGLGLLRVRSRRKG